MGGEIKAIAKIPSNKISPKTGSINADLGQIQIEEENELGPKKQPIDVPNEPKLLSMAIKNPKMRLKLDNNIKKIKDKLKLNIEKYEKWSSTHVKEGLIAFVQFRNIKDALNFREGFKRRFHHRACFACKKNHPEIFPRLFINKRWPKLMKAPEP